MFIPSVCLITRPGEIGDGFAGVSDDLVFKSGEVASEGAIFVADVDDPRGFERDRESSVGKMAAEGEDDGSFGEDGKVDPNGLKRVFDAEQAAGSRVRPRPGDVAGQVDRQAVAQGRTRSQDPFDRFRR